jgi:hypothetical protein
MMDFINEQQLGADFHEHMQGAAFQGANLIANGVGYTKI